LVFLSKVFHCVHLEAPAQVPLDSNAVEIEQEISKITKKVVCEIITQVLNLMIKIT